MTYKGDKIGDKPTIGLLEVYIAEKGLFCEPSDVYDYWENKKWTTKKGTPVKTLEAAVNVYNGIAITKKKNEDKKKLKKTKQLLLQKNKEKKEYIPYHEQLSDKRWQAFRNFVFVVRGQKCEICGSTNMLQVHHIKYKKDRLAWEYTCNEVQVLCKDCHSKIHNII